MIKFYTTKDEYGVFSNFYRAPVIIAGLKWPTTEHYYQAQKATTYEDMEKIRTAESPKEAARLGRSLSEIRPDWEAVKYEFMKIAVRAKMNQCSYAFQKLMDTGDEEIIEWTEGTALADSIWGNAKDKNGNPGQNLLGKVLMEIREEINNEGPTRMPPYTPSEIEGI